MQAISARRLWAGLLVAGAVAAGTIALTGTASADQERAQRAVTTIKMKLENGQPFFQAPSSVDRNDRLKVVNRTSPRRIGPHTFTLIKESLLPEGRQVRKCGNLEYRPCKRGFEAHRVDPETFEVRRPIVEKGRTGWDRAFTKVRKGDSFYTETRGESHGRKVKADSGDTLAFFCLIHPKMQGTLEVK